MNKTLEQISKESIEKYGQICKNEFCGLHQKFCRCDLAEERRNKRMRIIAQNGNEGYHYEENSNL